MMKRIVSRSLWGSALVAVLVAAGGVSSAAAATSYVFEPVRSVTGDCTTSEVDEVQDPSCPYPPPPAGPREPLENPTGLAIDSYGDEYVALWRPFDAETHIAVFNSEGRFLTDEINVPDLVDPEALAIDSEGHLYVSTDGSKIFRYDPDPEHYDPAAGEIAYEEPPTAIYSGESSYAIAVNPQNDHLFVNFGTPSTPNDEFARSAIVEFGSAEEGNPPLDKEVAEVCCYPLGAGIAVDATQGRLYATSQSDLAHVLDIEVFELNAPHTRIETIKGSSTPEGSFVTKRGLALAADEATGHLFAYDEERLNVIYEMTEDGQYLSSIKHDLSNTGIDRQIAVDNGEYSPNGALRPDGRYLWATADPGKVGHLFAFEPREQCKPVVESLSVAHIGESEALLQAEVEPCQLPTSYHFEVVSQQQFAESGFTDATVAGEGTIPAGGAPVKVSAGATGLTAGTRYHVRVRATNELGSGEAEDTFRTYPSPPLTASCPEAVRNGPSALLPDCRAYELVTPANTDGFAPTGGGSLGPLFLSPTVSSDGGRAFFGIEGGIIPGTEGTGSLAGDPYLASREEGDGWSTVGTGGKGSEFVAVARGGRSPDQQYSAWQGTADGTNSNYVRFPDGHSELVGQGTLGTDPAARPLLISDTGAMVFSSSALLEPKAFAGGAIYERTDGSTQVVSLLPHGITPSQPATYVGGSQDGRGIAFEIGSGATAKLYLRYNGEETYLIGEGVIFEGVAEGGKRIFYLEEGKLYAFDVGAGIITFAKEGAPTVVNVSRDGSVAYFVSRAKLTSVPNPMEKKAKVGEENLYLSREGAIKFVGIVTERDVVGEGFNVRRDGLGLWSGWVDTIGGLPEDPSRTSVEGSVLLFSSRADLTAFDTNGHPEIYRYDSTAGTLLCLSCNATERPALADAALQSVGEDAEVFPTWVSDRIENLTSDGSRAFFESTEPLVAADVDGLRDVYEWEAGGVGSCNRPEGCVFLISSGRSAQDNFLYGVGENGDDVFIETNDLLVPERDPDETRSIYDARVNGGFPVPSKAGECLGEACQPTAAPPERPAQALNGFGNAKRKHCPRGRRAVVRRHGRLRCARSHHHRRHHSRHTTVKGGRKHR
jgi:hypothetical protein